MKILKLFFLCLCPVLGISQNSFSGDSLKLIIEQAIDYQKRDAYSEAANLLSESIGNVDEKTVPDSLLAYAYHKLGVSQFYLSFNEDAIQSWSKALKVRSKLFSENHIDIIKGHFNIASAYGELGQYDFAQSNMENALKLNLSLTNPDSNLLTEVYRELGYILAKQNDFANSEIYLNAAAELSPIIFKEEPWEIAHTYNLLVLLHLQQNRPRKMIEFAQKGLKIYNSLSEKYEEDYIEMAHFNNNIGIAYQKLKEYDKAEKSFQEAINLYKKFSAKSETLQAKTFNNLAVLYLDAGLLKKALLNVDKAIFLDEDNHNFVSLAGKYNTKSEILLRKNEYEKSILNNQKGIQYLLEDFQPSQVNELPIVNSSIIGNKPLLVELLFDKALIYDEYSSFTFFKENLSFSLQTIDSTS